MRPGDQAHAGAGSAVLRLVAIWWKGEVLTCILTRKPVPMMRRSDENR